MSAISLRTVAVCAVLAALTACKNPFTPKEGTIDQGGSSGPTGIRTPVQPNIVLDNFHYIYNFVEHGMAWDDAVTEYRKCFVESDTDTASGVTYQFSFQYKDVSGGVVGQDILEWLYDEEMEVTENMFTTVHEKGLNLELRHFSTVRAGIEAKEDSLLYENHHPGEDWYVYEKDVYMIIDNPFGGKPYLVEGDNVFYVRRCSDGLYRIVKWVDRTYESINQKAKTAYSE